MNRNKLIRKLDTKLRKEGEGLDVTPTEERKDKQFIYYGKPFSYFYQAKRNMNKG